MPTSVGFNAGDGALGFNLLEEISAISPLDNPTPFDLTELSNVGIPGAFYFRVDEVISQPGIIVCGVFTRQSLFGELAKSRLRKVFPETFFLFTL